MWSAVLLALLALTAGTFAYVYRRQRLMIDALRKAREKIQLEETRVFDFLHGLGAALTAVSKPADLHMLIVEGALRILDGHGGALYLSDRAGDILRPAFATRNCPPFFDVPEKLTREPNFSWPGYLRLRTVAPEDGVLGSVWSEQEPLLLRGEDSRLVSLRIGPLRTKSAMLCPLFYGEESLGVLAIARGPGSDDFIPSDFQIFKAISEQSAFALYTATIFSEAAEKKRLDQDLQVAHEIQRILLPANAPEISGFQISGINVPARQVSGDYYDYICVDDTHCGLAIADVSGKGVPASLIMAMCRSVLRSQASNQLSPSTVLREVNAQLFPDIKEDMFISMAYAIIQQDSGTITLCRAGHDAPLLYSARDKTVSKINPPGMALGIDSGGVFNRVTNDFSLTLETDDCLVLYTDGVTEALDSQGEEFGMASVIKAIQASASEGAAGIITRLTDDLRAFVGNHPQHDDITLIVIRKK
ncbi:protein serine phosphatase with GAF(s) sensor(s) [Chthoniobacter flavus Ellin428]|uniref:Protein serine phosphatase with GAF(S) sensor(S) n=1 Tax=Chthoniobacter flavus Ellin428 TaxID=497964 RepID=B4D415_9BACT|nr:SpoIIE family protein phosphatase [Chthoniobacter flavus]EDY18995.1 protein serine phosphatase with GAF(s) sensor(s) [Chthoniobacter flavus Ellin428]TCO93576.1 sigma-B regulation protein RsbU (phosphoserine phosphatase) [Chthoniobacter flavus]